VRVFGAHATQFTIDELRAQMDKKCVHRRFCMRAPFV
jgi:hypothetical protein